MTPAFRANYAQTTAQLGHPARRPRPHASTTAIASPGSGVVAATDATVVLVFADQTVQNTQLTRSFPAGPVGHRGLDGQAERPLADQRPLAASSEPEAILRPRSTSARRDLTWRCALGVHAACAA